MLALAGIGVAITLIFMQLGFLGAVQDSATKLFDTLKFDLIVRSPEYLHVADAGQIDKQVLHEIAVLEGVEAVYPFRITRSSWQDKLGRPQGLLLMGIDPNDSPFDDARVNEHMARLQSTGSLLMDRKSHPDFSPLNGRRFSELDIGRTVVVAEQRLHLSGLYTLGSGLTSNGAALVSDRTFSELLPYFPYEKVSMGLICVQSPDQVEVLRKLVESRFRAEDGSLPFEVLPRSEVNQRELKRWIMETPIGFIFSLGVGIAAIVGTAIVYSVLANDVASRMPEYATLRAMGYRSSYLAGVVMRQSWYLALFAFVPSLVLSLGLYKLTGSLASIDLSMTWQRVVIVLVMTLGICSVSGLLALKKLWQVQPADLF